MIFTNKHAVLTLSTLMLGIAGCTSTSSCTNCAEMDMSMGQANSVFQETTVTLQEDTIIEVSYASIKANKMADLQQKYFPKALPIAAEYGGKQLAMFNVTAKTGGEMEKPHLIAIFEWPSIEAMQKLHNDPRMRELGKIRDGAISFFRQAYYTVEDETSIVFRSDKTYEFFTAWLNPNSGSALNNYFKVSAPMKKRHGPPIFKAILTPLENAPNSSHIIKPQMAGIVEWPNTQTYYDLTADSEFANKAAPLLKQAVARLDMIHAKIIFN